MRFGVLLLVQFMLIRIDGNSIGTFQCVHGAWIGNPMVLLNAFMFVHSMVVCIDGHFNGAAQCAKAGAFHGSTL